MPTNNGKLKELEMVANLNEKRVAELSNNLRNLLTALLNFSFIILSSIQIK